MKTSLQMTKVVNNKETFSKKDYDESSHDLD